MYRYLRIASASNVPAYSIAVKNMLLLTFRYIHPRRYPDQSTCSCQPEIPTSAFAALFV